MSLNLYGDIMKDKIATLGWHEVYKLGKTDNANRWYPNEEVKEYFNGYRLPSRAYPWSYAKAAMTQKFARWLYDNHPDIYKRLGLS